MDRCLAMVSTVETSLLYSTESSSSTV